MKAMKEIGRVTAPGGQGFFTDFHPYGLFAKKGKEQVRPYTSGIRGIEDYYKTARQAGLRIIDLKEAFIDEAFRPLFAVSEIQSYRNLKGTPLAIFVFFFKPQTKSA